MDKFVCRAWYGGIFWSEFFFLKPEISSARVSLIFRTAEEATYPSILAAWGRGKKGCK